MFRFQGKFHVNEQPFKIDFPSLKKNKKYPRPYAYTLPSPSHARGCANVN